MKMIEKIKEVYIPSPFTLAMQQTFGDIQKSRKNIKINRSHYRSDSKMPRFTMKKNIYDKQHLLHQLQLEKQRNHQIKIQTKCLKTKFANTKNKLILNYVQTENISFNSLNTIKRQIQAMIDELSIQKQQIQSIKRSKKYNRYMELVNMKQIYLQQISSLKQKIKYYKYYEKQQKKIIKQQIQKKKKMKIINKNIQENIIDQTENLKSLINSKQQSIKQSLTKNRQLNMKRQKLVKDILLLQNKTGKIYITQQFVKKPLDSHHEQMSQSKEKWQKQTKDTQKFAQIRQNDEDESEESQETQIQGSEQNEVKTQQFTRTRQGNLSF